MWPRSGKLPPGCGQSDRTLPSGSWLALRKRRESPSGCLWSSQQPPLRERHRSRAGNDEVIEGLDLDQRQRLLERLRQQLVGPAWLSNARRMVVREDDACGVVAKRGLHDF